MATNQLIISLAPDKLSAATVRKGRVVQGEQIDLNSEDWEGIWSDGLMRLDQPLKQILSRFSSRSLPSATLIYQSPTVTQQVHTFDLHPEAAREAALAKIRDGIGLSDPVQSCLLSDPSVQTDSATVLVYSEREEQLRSMYAWLNRCGISVKSLVPTSVAMMETAAKIAANTEPDTAVFYLGTDVSVLAYATESGIKLIRSAEIGYRKLVTGYMQAFSCESAGGAKDERPASAEHNADAAVEAAKMLFVHGIPMKNNDINGIELRSTVLPILAPVLQRFCIEIKQTFRFGLREERMPKNLMITGPGASIPMMTKAISQHIDMHNLVDHSVEGFNPNEAFGRGSMERTLIESRACPDGLMPEIARDAKTRSLLNRSLVAGGIAAAIVMGGEYVIATLEYKKITNHIDTNSARLKAVTAFHEQSQSASELVVSIKEVSQLVSDTVEGLPQWHSILTDLAAITSDSIRVQELRGEYSKGSPYVEINGLAVAESEKATGQALNKFLSELEGLDGIDQVGLGATTRISMGDDKWGRQFTMRVTLKLEPMLHHSFAQADLNEQSGRAP